MDAKYTNNSAPKPPRCHSCARPMQLLRRTSRLAGCLISTPSTASHVMSGTLRKGTRSSDPIAWRAWQLRAKRLGETPQGSFRMRHCAKIFGIRRVLR